MHNKKNAVALLLQKNKQGLSILEIARALSFSRNTVAVKLAELKGAGQITIRSVGKAKFHYWKKLPEVKRIVAGKTKKEQVTNLLKGNKQGLTIVEIATILSMSRNTVAVKVAELKGAKKISVRTAGMAKLHFWKYGKKN